MTACDRGISGDGEHAEERRGCAGRIADPGSLWPGDYYNTLEHKRKVYSHPDVITLDQLPSF